MASKLEILRTLDSELRARREFTDLFERYYDGDHRLAFATEKYRDAFGTLFGAFADNWCAVIADTPNERLEIEGFTVGTESDEANEDAWNVWLDSDMEVQSSIAMLGAIKTGISYVLVDVTATKPEIRVWPSSMAIVQRDPKSRRIIAGLVTWTEADGSRLAELYLPKDITRFRAEKKGDPNLASSHEATDPKKRKWTAVKTWRNPHADGSIPLVELVNRPNELWVGKSDLGDVIALQDAINKLANDMIVASEFQAFRQRVLTGVEIPKDPETGQPLASQEIKAAISRLWAFENPEARVHDIPAADLGNYVSGIKEMLNHLAGQTRTPPHYLLGQMVNVSGEALAAAESGLVSRVIEKQTSFSTSWREVMRLATGKDDRFEVVWKNPERISISQRADAVSKLAATDQLGLPRAEFWRMLGYSPLKIKELEKRAAEVEKKIAEKPKPEPPDPRDALTGQRPLGDQPQA